MILIETDKRTLSVVFDEGNFLIEEIVTEGKRRMTDVVWLTAQEIEKINDFKKQMTGESR